MNKNSKNINYWNKNVTQTWYSDNDLDSVQWFNELSRKRYEEIFEYKYKFAEFLYHRGEKVLDIGWGPGTDAAEYAKNGAIVSAINLNEEQKKILTEIFPIDEFPFNSKYKKYNGIKI